MELNEFTKYIAEQFNETEAELFVPETRFRELEEYDSLIGLSIIAAIDSKYRILIKGEDIRSCSTIEDLYKLVESKK